MKYFGTYENLAASDRVFEANAFQGSATAQCHIGLSAGKYSSREVDMHIAESESLTFVHGDSPCQSNWELYIGAYFLLFAR